MQGMKVIVIGMGSMGRRRTELLVKNYTQIKVSAVESDEGRRKRAEEEYHIKVYADLETALTEESPDAAFVCTSPESHGNIIMECAVRGLHIFSEINLLPNRYDEILKESRMSGKTLYLSSTQLYRKEIELIQKLVTQHQNKLNYHYHVGQYLPDWHPWDQKREFFAWSSKTNGCREILAIELPWILKTFGAVKEIMVWKDHLSSLPVDYPDNYMIVMLHENGSKGVLLTDIVSRKAIRALTVYSEDLLIQWRGTPDSLVTFNLQNQRMERVDTYLNAETKPGYAEFIIENAYLEEIEAFLRKMEGDSSLERYTFEEDAETLKLINRIEGLI
ncbi:Gfo/Idh/MocA family oxidoreductase [Anoxybacterium hadale]|uniref:Gfo/Idh/MocA family oxidoreductase n=1 Tax=Anoxybacterium hadale TaxID=3408580 RepID=A0ACD1AAJ9_9FIRM|nr:Gfo/Idh/MocA family oxidoreductase [Clostridiales bacterium]